METITSRTDRGRRTGLHLTLSGRVRRRIQTSPETWERLNAERLSLSQDSSDAIQEALRQLALGGAPARWSDLTLDDRAYLVRHAAGMQGCADVLAFREAQCGTYDVGGAVTSCRSRLCAYCERQRATHLLEKFDAVVQTVPRHRRSYLVCTIRNIADLTAGWRLIGCAFTKMRGRPLFRGGRCRWRDRAGKPGHKCDHKRPGWLHPGCRADRNCRRYRHTAVVGGVNAYEVTHHHDGVENVGDDGLRHVHRCRADCEGMMRPWHPHLNVIMDAPFIPQEEIADTWRALTCSDPKHGRRGYCPPECDQGSPVVWIAQVEPGTTRDTIKYVTKTADLLRGDDPWPVVEFVLAARGKRMVQGWGSFFGVAFDEESPREEQVTLFGDVIAVVNADGVSHEVRRRYRLPRRCPSCGRDTALNDGRSTWEPPIVVPRKELRVIRGVVVWKPPGSDGVRA